jgi:hypothetical protein
MRLMYNVGSHACPANFCGQYPPGPPLIRQATATSLVYNFELSIIRLFRGNCSNPFRSPNPVNAYDATSAYYSTKSDDTGGMVVREWLRTKSYEEQRAFGLMILKRFGVIP